MLKNRSNNLGVNVIRQKLLSPPNILYMGDIIFSPVSLFYRTTKAEIIVNILKVMHTHVYPKCQEGKQPSNSMFAAAGLCEIRSSLGPPAGWKQHHHSKTLNFHKGFSSAFIIHHQQTAGQTKVRLNVNVKYWTIMGIRWCSTVKSSGNSRRHTVKGVSKR